MRRASTRAALGILLAGLLHAAPAAALEAELAAMRFSPYDPPRPAPDFTLPDLEGRPWSLAALRGRPVLLFFWTTW